MPIVNWIDVSYGEEVAILPYTNCPLAELLGIQVVEDIGSGFIELSNGQKFTQLGGISLDGNACIVPATEEHRAALKAKRKEPSSTAVPLYRFLNGVRTNASSFWKH
jgi:hypothetical protein